MQRALPRRQGDRRGRALPRGHPADSPRHQVTARVEVRQLIEQAGMLPWAVPEVEPAAVAALFVDENSGDVVLRNDSTSGTTSTFRSTNG